MSNIQKILLIFGILAFIVTLEVCLSRMTDNLVDQTLQQLENLTEILKNEDFEKSKSKSEELKQKWFEYEEKLAFFMEHDELEKISLKIAIISENSLNEAYDSALEDVIETTYLLEHVKDKLKLKIKNIF